jgi:transposase
VAYREIAMWEILEVLRRVHRGERQRAIERVFRALAEALYQRGQIEITEGFSDGTFSGADKGGALPPRRASAGRGGTKTMSIADRSGLPVAAGIACASPAQVTLVEAMIDHGFLDVAPDCLIGDKAYDSDGLDEQLWEDQAIELISPHRRNRKRAKTQDGRRDRRYKRRWQIEQLFAWLHNFDRLITRQERQAENLLAFLELESAGILLRGS